MESPDRCRPRPRPDRAVQVLGSSSYSSRPSTRSSARAIRRLGKASYAEKLHERSTSPSDRWSGISRAGLAFPSPVSLNLRTTTTSSTDQRPCCESGSGLGVWCLACRLVPSGCRGRRLCAACGANAGGPMCACRMARITLSGHLGCGAEASLARPRTVGSGQLRRRISSCTDSTSVVKFSSRTTRVASARATPLLKAAPPK